MGDRQAFAQLRSCLITMLGWGIAHFMVAFAGVWLARRYAMRRNLLDQPGERRSHSVATPRGGGIGIVFALVSGGVWWIAVHWDSNLRIPALAFLTGMMLVASIGWIDDHKPLSPWLRLGVHAIAGGLLAVGVFLATASLPVAVCALILAMTLTNVWNFMDGIDGIAASQAALVAGGVLLLLWPGASPLAVALLAACLGFLPFNFPRACIFMGDVGSGTLGYCIAALLVQSGMELKSHWPLLAFLVSAFFVDASFTLALRIVKGEKWWQPHTQHLYQRWVKTGRSHIFVTLTYAAFSLVALISAMILRRVGMTGGAIIGAVAGWYAAASLLWLAYRKHLHPD